MDFLEFTSFLIRKHPVLLLIFMLSAVGSLCGIPFYGAYERVILDYGINITWIQYSCTICPVYIITGLLSFALFGIHKAKEDNNSGS